MGNSEMKRQYQWIFWLLLSKLTICLVGGEFMILSGPEYNTGYITYRRHLTRDMYCITDDIGSALTWNGNLDWVDPELAKPHEIVKPYLVLPDDNYVYSSNENFTCQLSATSNCSSYWKRVGNHWSFTTSLMKPMGPVFDNRWEDFQEERMSNRFKAITTIFSEGSLSVSIRGSTDAHFAICNGFNVSSFCFYVILGGWVNKQSVIRKCENGIPELASEYPSGDCLTKLAVANGSVLSSTEWRTFTIKWDFTRKIALSIYDVNGILLNYQVPKKMSNFQGQYRKLGGGEEYVLFARSPVNMLMKFHIYGFSLTKVTQAKLLSPSIVPASDEGNICVEMSVNLCHKCTLLVDFIDRNGQSRVAGTIANKDWSTWHGLPIWRNIRISRRIPDEMLQNRPVQLRFTTLTANATSNTYWAISNIRRCRNGTLKVTKIKAPQDSTDSTYFWPNITCQKISPDTSSTVLDSTDRRISSVKAEYKRLCPEGKVGRSCSVTCPKLFWENNDCRKLMACDESGCSCAQGFMMPTCSENCPTSMYGFECKRKCGHCAHGLCNFVTGQCTYGCESADNVYYKPPYCHDGVKSPPPPSVVIINPTTVRVHLEINTINEYKIMPTNVTFEIWENSSSPYYVSESIPIYNDTFVTQIINESMHPGTQYQAVVLLHVGNRILRGETKNFTTPCTESTGLNFVTHSNETSIILENQVDPQINDSCPYTWYHVQLYTVEDMIFNNVTTFPKLFSDLTPYTEYKLIIKSQKLIIVNNRMVKTTEGVPSPVRSLRAMSSTSNQIHFIWMSPEKPYGKIVNYTLEIEPLQFLGCKDSYQTSNGSLKNSISELYHKEVIETNGLQSTFNYTFHNLKPYTMYSIIVYASNSKHKGNKTVSNYATAEIKIPTEIYSNLRMSNDSTSTSVGTLWWNLPKDCSTITGPIRASKVFVKKLGKNFTEIKTKYFYYPLEESMFEGSETYEVRVHVLRDFDELENKEIYLNLTFTMPPRAPPPVNNVEIIEVNIQNKTITLRWEPPYPPLHGILDGYDIKAFNSKSRSCFQTNSFFTKANQFCDLWMLNNKLCMTIPFPIRDCELQVTARNINVTEGSKPVIVPLRRTEMTPTIPLDLILFVAQRENSIVNASWSHPLISGGKITKFIIEAHLLTTNLKVDPANRIIGIYNVSNYKPRYSMELNLQPSSTFEITVSAVTFGKTIGNKAQETITLPTIVNFNTTDLKGRTNNDLMIRIRIPEVKHDIKGSMMVVVVQGPQYCDEGESNNEDVKLFLNTGSSSYYKVAWKAATIMDPESWANKEFIIGDGETYGGSKNYLLCSKESYIVHLVLAENPKLVDGKNYSLGMNILKTIKTDAIHIGELTKNYAAWLTPLIFITLLAGLLLFVLYRKKLTSCLMKDKTIVNGQENMPLANDFSRKKSKFSRDEVENNIKIMDTKDMPNNNIFIIERKVEFVMPVKVKDFERYFESAFKLGQLNQEYSTIKCGLTKPYAYGSQTETKPKNRYGNLYPYDDTRVILEKLDDDPYSDYINASYITGYGGKRKTYIATQGPKPNTVIDFWRMIWQEKVQIICMMANLMENGKVKCEQYWPSLVGKRVLYGKISVRFESEEIHCDYTYRTFQISCENQQGRMIEHLHYTAWPDHGVPSNPRSIVAFLKEIQRHSPMPRQDDDPPIVVHCSAGVGRTGTLIVLDMCLSRAFSEEVVDVYANVLSVREERLNMVDNTDQYLLVHLVLMEYFNTKDTCFECDKSLTERLTEAKKNSPLHYQRILDTSWWSEVLGSPPLPEKSLSNRNRMKHRFPESAGGLNRLYLKRSLINDEDSDYIAATCVRNLFKDRQYITTQLPMPSTSGDFWRMLAENNVEVVLVLQSPNLQDPTYCELVPENQGYGSVKYLKIVRQENSTTDTKHYFKEEVFLVDSSEQPSKEQFVKILSFKKWPESSLPDPNELVELWKAFESFPKKDNCPIVIVCRNGITASGIWLTTSFLLQRMTVDNECDIPQAVKAIRSCRKDFFNQPEYLDYLYDIALVWSRQNLHH